MSNIRNIAIIAHVDHGKSTLVDALLKQTKTDLGKSAGGELIMDFNELERERGITIFSKNASVEYNGVKVNIIDTPGHADFGGEVERVLNMADGSLLLVDAQEGPMPQTRFVLKKALELGHKIIVVINKIDKPSSRVNYVLEKVIELFVELGATNDQLDFPILYAAGKLGIAGTTPDINEMKGIEPVLETVIKHVPAPKANKEEPFQVMAVSIQYDNYKGRLAIGRIIRGTIATGSQAVHITRDGKKKNFKITSIMTFRGLQKMEIEKCEAGDIVAISGVDDIMIGDTIADPTNPEQLTPIAIERPTVKMIFSVNNSPFAGQEGEFCTSRNIRERLNKELDNDVALDILSGSSPDEFIVAGRGELHLSILIEKMRREGYELQVSRPEVIFKEENGKTLEPYEDVWIEASEKYSGMIIEKMSMRKGEMKNMSVENSMVSFHFFIPTRGLIGFRNEFMIETKGTGLANTLFSGYFPKREDIITSPHGSLIAHETGTTTAYALLGSQERGVMFVEPAEKVYEGQIVGQNAKAEDLVVNVCKAKQLTNFRAKTDAVTDDLVPKREMSLEQALEYIGDDELVEATPKNIRLRKKILKNSLRKK
ncbi:MAG: translational GTPase TypA [Candidatus Harrisonbacteria bacterium CG10_big_fil_rev_8_21_14_0_10_40_38]|uniref:50S ribosomal subunit assembly factor BipA n=1 Tax=Candidatus Harrisonbacteria bacterium CG10_big_fil_rev_8_21_14_0_10_40_38 TaxID=1974583 RepID=A0A2H0UUS2_9BACT|nr:MAG: translational GTPase TypA [Candidatus Harrisonbacteria bacterium CG10_big_fil_rev_8_21_14_0_10_40_38]